MLNDYEKRIAKLEKDLKDLNAEFYRNNFTSNQDFNKFVRFNSHLKIPNYTALPATCEVSQVGVYSGKLYVCSAANTWTVAGTQS